MSEEPVSKQAKMASALDQLKEHTVVVADTGDFGGNYFTMPQTALIVLLILI